MLETVSQSNLFRSGALLFVALLLGALTGCPSVVDDPGDGSDGVLLLDGNQDPSVSSPLGKTSGEPNNSFMEPMVAVFDNSDSAKLQGNVSRAGDLDVFVLGSLSAGDRVLVDTATRNSVLDTSIALFDSAGRLSFENDDRCENFVDPDCLNSSIDWIVRHDAERYFLVVTHAAFAAPSTTKVGSYTVDVRIERGGDVPAPRRQVLLLDFNGASVNSPVLGTLQLTSFNAADIDPAYQGQTDLIKQTIVDIMGENYSRFNVVIATSDDPPTIDGSLVSMIFFGGLNETAFGLAEAVDLNNIDLCDDAIIYTESFSPFQFTRLPTAEEMGVAIGNVTSHEAGHLLGLNHVSDDLDIMDDRSPADLFLSDQEFLESDLSSDIMSIGTQDSVLLLTETVGLFDADPE
ncbi:MAG: hypothetical protein AABZ47_08635 [Planctomycetota bacterium]